MSAKRCFQNTLLIIALAAILSFISTSMVLAAPTMKRLSGIDRYKTAVAISTSGWSTSQYVVLANGEDFPDALCASPLAKQLKSPILLTTKGQLGIDTINRIKSLNTKKVFIIGGVGVISKGIEDTLKITLGLEVERLWGASRYETSLKIAEYMNSNFIISKEIAVVSGENFPDALSIAPIASLKGMPIILTPQDKLSDNTKAYINEKGITKAYIIGGTGVVSEAVLNKLPIPERIWGSDRYKTNINVIQRFVPGDGSDVNIDISSMFIASGQNFPDALSGSALASLHSSAVILTSKVPSAITKQYTLNMWLGSPTGAIYILGGEGAVSKLTIEKLSTREKIINKNVTVGSTLDQVKAILGEPTSELPDSTNYQLYYEINAYEGMYIKLELTSNGFVVYGWMNASKFPKVSLGEKVLGAKPVTIGSSIEDVVAALGSPDTLDKGYSYNAYGFINGGYVHVDHLNKVIGWGNITKLNVNMGSKDPNFPGIKIGSTKEEIVKAMGTPATIGSGINFSRYWQYGKSYIGVDDENNVMDWINNGDLKIDSSFANNH